jgi:hypothetical protein
MSCECEDREFFPYVLILHRKVGEFSIWPLDQLADARKEFKHDRVQIIPIPSLAAETQWAGYIGSAIWEYFHEVLHLIPIEIVETGGRFKFSSGSEDTLNSMCGMPEFFKNAH